MTNNRSYVDHSATVGDLDLGVLVADIGSHSCRIGFAGDDQPKASFASVGFLTLIVHNFQLL